MRANGVFVAVGLQIIACGGGTASMPEDDGGTDAADGGASDAGAVDASVSPAACNDTTPFATEACGIALQERCRALADERTCESARSVVLGGSEFEFVCAWTKVVQFSDTETCTVASTQGRCEAYIVQTIPCTEACGPEPGGLYDSLHASVSERALVQNPCLGRRTLDGPIGRGTFLGNQQTDTREWHSCGADSPPPPADLCACSAIACEQ